MLLWDHICLNQYTIQARAGVPLQWRGEGRGGEGERDRGREGEGRGRGRREGGGGEREGREEGGVVKGQVASQNYQNRSSKHRTCSLLRTHTLYMHTCIQNTPLTARICHLRGVAQIWLQSNKNNEHANISTCSTRVSQMYIT